MSKKRNDLIKADVLWRSRSYAKGYLTQSKSVYLFALWEVEKKAILQKTFYHRSFGYALKKIFHNLTFFSISHIFV